MPYATTLQKDIGSAGQIKHATADEVIGRYARRPPESSCQEGTNRSC
jgi:hypothetical protein